MNTNKRLWLILAGVFIASFAVLGFMGREIYLSAPPVPRIVMTADGQPVFTGAEIERGRNVWQSMGGQEVGSIWGHGAYVAPDWSADWLHREATGLLELWAQRDYGKPFAQLGVEAQGALTARLRADLRKNTYDASTRAVTVSPDRAKVDAALRAYYGDLFGTAQNLQTLRGDYAIPVNAVPDASRRHDLGAFFFWTAWAAVTDRPGSASTYTNNWPADALVGNTPTTPTFLWTIISIMVLLAGVGALAWHYAVSHGREPVPEPPAGDPLLAVKPTPSMKATAKYFWVVIGLLALQVLLGAITAHYAVEGEGFYGFPLAKYLPYAVTRTWHTQLAVFWIATAWLATGLYIAPAVSGHEPRFQRLGVNFLWTCLLIIVVGSMAGEWFSIQQHMGLVTSFWFGTQGYEYVDLGRFWQIFLFVGLMLWLLLVGRALWPALSKRGEQRPLILILFLSTVAIGLFYGAGLLWGRHTSLVMVEYWRWWVVHLWVEGFFEVFATTVIAFLFVRLGLLRVGTATTAVIFSTVVFMTGGILGTFHHLYWTGTPTGVLALGASFSALEIVPLVLVGFEAYENYKLSRARSWVATYRWPIMFFIAVSFWNLVGAGLFGFLINPPLALYYMQGLNTTAMHGHSALFGVYGMLGIGLMLFCLRGLRPREVWAEPPLQLAFWALNIGLGAMVAFSLAPVGIAQTWASVTHGFWYARSAAFLHQPLVQALVWMRVPGDVIFAFGVLCLAWFIGRLWWPRKAVQPQGIPAQAGVRSRLRD